jgi:hypothetical protein
MPEINLIPKEYKSKGMGLGNIFSKTGGIVLALLILSLLIFGGLLLYKNKIKTELNDTMQKIAELDSKRNNDSELKIYYADQKLNLVSSLFKNHFYWSKLFTKIQDLTVSEIYFSEFKSAILEGKLEITLSGNADTYTLLARQMVVFKDDPTVEKIDLTKTALSEAGGVNFDFLIIFKNSILLEEIEKNG